MSKQFCNHCGAQLLMVARRTSKHDGGTGEVLYKAKVHCPNSTTLFNKHTSFDVVDIFSNGFWGDDRHEFPRDELERAGFTVLV